MEARTDRLDYSEEPGEPHQHGPQANPASLPSCLAQLRYHTDMTISLQAPELLWASPQGAASHGVEVLRGITV